jgi:hypothetical protein
MRAWSLFDPAEPSGISLRRFARTAEFLQPDQADLGCPAAVAKTFLFTPDPNHI